MKQKSFYMTMLTRVITQLLSLLPFFRRRPTRPVVPELTFLPLVEKEFIDRASELQQIRDKARDVILWLATVLHYILSREGLGDEYGIYEPIVRQAIFGSAAGLRRLMRYRELIEPPRYTVIYGILRPVPAIRLLQYSDVSGITPILKIAQLSTVIDMPFTFIADLKDIYITPTPVDPDKLLRTGHIARLPGPRLYYTIEKCLSCVSKENEEICSMLVIDDVCMDVSALAGELSRRDLTADVEVIYVEKRVKYTETRISRRIIIAFCYSLSKLLTDEDLYKAFCQIF